MPTVGSLWYVKCNPEPGELICVTAVNENTVTGCSLIRLSSVEPEFTDDSDKKSLYGKLNPDLALVYTNWEVVAHITEIKPAVENFKIIGRLEKYQRDRPIVASEMVVTPVNSNNPIKIKEYFDWRDLPDSMSFKAAREEEDARTAMKSPVEIGKPASDSQDQRDTNQSSSNASASQNSGNNNKRAKLGQSSQVANEPSSASTASTADPEELLNNLDQKQQQTIATDVKAQSKPEASAASGSGSQNINIFGSSPAATSTDSAAAAAGPSSASNHTPIPNLEGVVCFSQRAVLVKGTLYRRGDHVKVGARVVRIVRFLQDFGKSIWAEAHHIFDAANPQFSDEHKAAGRKARFTHSTKRFFDRLIVRSRTFVPIAEFGGHALKDGCEMRAAMIEDLYTGYHAEMLSGEWLKYANKAKKLTNMNTLLTSLNQAELKENIDQLFRTVFLDHEDRDNGTKVFLSQLPGVTSRVSQKKKLCSFCVQPRPIKQINPAVNVWFCKGCRYKANLVEQVATEILACRKKAADAQPDVDHGQKEMEEYSEFVSALEEDCTVRVLHYLTLYDFMRINNRTTVVDFNTYANTLPALFQIPGSRFLTFGLHYIDTQNVVCWDATMRSGDCVLYDAAYWLIVSFELLSNDIRAVIAPLKVYKTNSWFLSVDSAKPKSSFGVASARGLYSIVSHTSAPSEARHVAVICYDLAHQVFRSSDKDPYLDEFLWETKKTSVENTNKEQDTDVEVEEKEDAKSDVDYMNQATQEQEDAIELPNPNPAVETSGSGSGAGAVDALAATSQEFAYSALGETPPLKAVSATELNLNMSTLALDSKTQIKYLNESAILIGDHMYRVGDYVSYMQDEKVKGVALVERFGLSKTHKQFFQGRVMWTALDLKNSASGQSTDNFVRFHCAAGEERMPLIHSHRSVTLPAHTICRFVQGPVRDFRMVRNLKHKRVDVYELMYGPEPTTSNVLPNYLRAAVEQAAYASTKKGWIEGVDLFFKRRFVHRIESRIFELVRAMYYGKDSPVLMPLTRVSLNSKSSSKCECCKRPSSIAPVTHTSKSLTMLICSDCATDIKFAVLVLVVFADVQTRVKTTVHVEFVVERAYSQLSAILSRRTAPREARLNYSISMEALIEQKSAEGLAIDPSDDISDSSESSGFEMTKYSLFQSGKGYRCGDHVLVTATSSKPIYMKLSHFEEKKKEGPVAIYAAGLLVHSYRDNPELVVPRGTNPNEPCEVTDSELKVNIQYIGKKVNPPDWQVITSLEDNTLFACGFGRESFAPRDPGLVDQDLRDYDTVVKDEFRANVTRDLFLGLSTCALNNSLQNSFAHAFESKSDKHQQLNALHLLRTMLGSPFLSEMRKVESGLFDNSGMSKRMYTFKQRHISYEPPVRNQLCPLCGSNSQAVEFCTPVSGEVLFADPPSNNSVLIDLKDKSMCCECANRLIQTCALLRCFRDGIGRLIQHFKDTSKTAQSKISAKESASAMAALSPLVDLYHGPFISSYRPAPTFPFFDNKEKLLIIPSEKNDL